MVDPVLDYEPKGARLSTQMSLAGRMLVPELIQEGCTPEAICRELATLLAQDNSALLEEFVRLHQLIRCDADKQAAEAVLQLLEAS